MSKTKCLLIFIYFFFRYHDETKPILLQEKIRFIVHDTRYFISEEGREEMKLTDPRKHNPCHVREACKVTFSLSLALQKESLIVQGSQKRGWKGGGGHTFLHPRHPTSRRDARGEAEDEGDAP